MTEHAALNLECNLTIAVRRECACAPYFIDRRAVLIPEVAKHADAIGADAVDEFARYARGVHQRHLAGLSLEVSA